MLSIQVWRFRDAPQEYKGQSEHGGDEDWLAIIPAGQEWPDWAKDGAFGCCDVSSKILENGSMLLIGAHS